MEMCVKAYGTARQFLPGSFLLDLLNDFAQRSGHFYTLKIEHWPMSADRR